MKRQLLENPLTPQFTQLETVILENNSPQTNCRKKLFKQKSGKDIKAFTLDKLLVQALIYADRLFQTL